MTVWPSILNVQRNNVCMLFNNVIFNLTGKYRIKINTDDCRLDNAQCEKIDNNCICHCYQEYMTVNGPCLKGKICGQIKHDLYRRPSYCWYNLRRQFLRVPEVGIYILYIGPLIMVLSLIHWRSQLTFNFFRSFLFFFFLFLLYIFYIHSFWSEFSIGKKKPDSFKNNLFWLSL